MLGVKDEACCARAGTAVHIHACTHVCTHMDEHASTQEEIREAHER